MKKGSAKTGLAPGTLVPRQVGRVLQARTLPACPPGKLFSVINFEEKQETKRYKDNFLPGSFVCMRLEIPMPEVMQALILDFPVDSDNI